MLLCVSAVVSRVREKIYEDGTHLDLRRLMTLFFVLDFFVVIILLSIARRQLAMDSRLNELLISRLSSMSSAPLILLLLLL